mmetsp:Transcript_17768/g.45952  ORF Transcript_17768/g.45952 Transcript_17768/m.45952 type:complete len:284 (+) Transcript_17768:299-1150(+)
MVAAGSGRHPHCDRAREPRVLRVGPLLSCLCRTPVAQSLEAGAVAKPLRSSVLLVARSHEERVDSRAADLKSERAPKERVDVSAARGNVAQRSEELNALECSQLSFVLLQDGDAQPVEDLDVSVEKDAVKCAHARLEGQAADEGRHEPARRVRARRDGVSHKVHVEPRQLRHDQPIKRVKRGRHTGQPVLKHRAHAACGCECHEEGECTRLGGVHEQCAAQQVKALAVLHTRLSGCIRGEHAAEEAHAVRRARSGERCATLVVQKDLMIRKCAPHVALDLVDD